MPGKGRTNFNCCLEESPFTIVDSGHGTAVLAQAWSIPPGVSSPSPLRLVVMGVRLAVDGLLTA